MADRSSNVLTDLADRRSALHALGAASTAILAVLGFGGVTGDARGEDKGKTDRNQRTKRTRHPEGTNRPADRGDEPAAPLDDASSTEPVKNASVTAQQKRKRRRSIRVVGDVTGPLPATAGAQVFSRAFCQGGDGKLLGGGYNVIGTPEQLENLIVVEAAPDAGAGHFTATLRRTSGSGSAAGATITAIAICKA